MNMDELVKVVESSLGRSLVENEKKWIFESLKTDPSFAEKLLQRLSQEKRYFNKQNS